MTDHKYSSDWINKLEDQNHWNLYWYQLKILDNKIDVSEKIAEIGVGSKFTYNYLKSKNFDVTSIDIDADKNPDVLLNIVDCEPSQLDYDIMLAFNIFEHITFEEFLGTIETFNKSKVDKLFFSIPANRKTIFEFFLRLGRYFNKEIKINIRKKKITTKHHHWEIDYKDFTKEKLFDELSKRNFAIQDFFAVRNQAYFYFKKMDS